MTAQHYNEVRLVARAAKQTGAALPVEITAGIAHIETLNTTPQNSANAGSYVADIVRHLGDPKALEKARAAAALALATAEADAKLNGHIINAASSRLRSIMRANAEAIAAAFGDALAADVDTLNADAHRLPYRFKADNAAALDGDTFTAWTRVRDAAARIDTTRDPLATIYAAAIPGAIGGSFTPAAAAALRWAKPPVFDNHTQAYAFHDALTGRAKGGSPLAPVTVDALFPPTALAELGATFEWAGPQEVGRRARQIIEAMTGQRDTGTVHAFA
ncbi:hypothetical protein SAMN05216199_1254 [Pedococcus cremeus]|uniref:Uncharacterized protein n=1 Tax=Pedococcus cremeus TaxID=587636 RepID=A0A1H9S5F5_9MICO|nr:hypothetical protein [Pedococcus cremeus]SER79845.1 hypothetical protein SAMN05216199_1254 [Pedococcus cremeus]